MNKNYKDIKVFRYKVKSWDVIEDKEITEYGFVFGLTTGDAVDRVESIYMKPNGISDMIDIYIYEIESYDRGVLTDGTIKETKEAEESRNASLAH